MFDKLKKILISKPSEDYDLQNKIAITNHKLSPKCNYDIFIDALKDQGYLIDRNIQLTEKDTEFIQTYNIEIRQIEPFHQGKFITNGNDNVMILTVPGNNGQVRFISKGAACAGGYSSKLDIEHYPKSDSFDNISKIEIIKYNTNIQLFRHITLININQCMIFAENGIEMTTGMMLMWKLRFPPVPPGTSPIQFIDVDIKKECIKYSGEWDICVHKDAQNKFSWWKDGKYVGSQNGK